MKVEGDLVAAKELLGNDPWKELDTTTHEKCNAQEMDVDQDDEENLDRRAAKKRDHIEEQRQRLMTSHPLHVVVTIPCAGTWLDHHFVTLKRGNRKKERGRQIKRERETMREIKWVHVPMGEKEREIEIEILRKKEREREREKGGTEEEERG